MVVKSPDHGLEDPPILRRRRLSISHILLALFFRNQLLPREALQNNVGTRNRCKTQSCQNVGWEACRNSFVPASGSNLLAVEQSNWGPQMFSNLFSMDIGNQCSWTQCFYCRYVTRIHLHALMLPRRFQTTRRKSFQLPIHLRQNRPTLSCPPNNCGNY